MKMRARDYLYDDSSSSESGRNHSLQRKHFCVICNKQFSCGKAYGGHVRIHSNEYSNKGKTKKKKTKRKILVESKIKCCLCGKEFKTMHSLFGHMRRHPDRSWKGIRPPSPDKSKLSFTDVTEDVQEGACCLMMLSYSTWETSSKSEVRSCNAEMDDNSLVVDMKIKMEIGMKMTNNSQAKKFLDFDLNQPYHHDDQDHSCF